MKAKKSQIILYIPLLILNVISLFNMLNAKLINSTYKYAFYKQSLWIFIGIIFIIIINKLNIGKKLFRYSNYLYILSIFLLIVVLIFGSNINGAKCWLNIFGFSFQPSELMKISLSLSLINLANKKSKNIKDEFFLLLKMLIITTIPCLLVFLEPDTGAIINYLIIFMIIIFSMKLNKFWYISFFIILFSFLSLFFIMYFKFQNTLISLIGTTFFYRMDRLINFTNGNSYQLEMSLINIGSSSFFGVGLNKILIYIPEAPTDFIFSFSIGNFGIFSAILILICYLILDIYLIKISESIQKKYQSFVYIFVSLLIFHEIYNIFMNLGLLPIMGIPLPFLSYGGTSMIINYIFLGIIINLKKKNKSS